MTLGRFLFPVFFENWEKEPSLISIFSAWVKAAEGIEKKALKPHNK